MSSSKAAQDNAMWRYRSYQRMNASNWDVVACRRVTAIKKNKIREGASLVPFFFDEGTV